MRRRDRPSSPTVLRWTMVLVPLGTLAVAALLWWAVSSEERARIEQMVGGEARNIASQVTSSIRFRAESIVRRTQQWILYDRATRADWEADVTWLRVLEPTLEVMAWAEPDGQVRWIVPSETAVEFLPTSADPGGRVTSALQRARATNGEVVTGPFALPDGDSGFLVIVPVVRGTEFSGNVLAFFDIPALVRAAIGDAEGGLALAVVADGREIYSRYPRDERPSEGWDQEVPIRHDELALTLRVWPTERTLALARSALPRIVLVSGVLLAIVVALLVRLVQVAALRTNEAQMNLDLQREIAARKRAERSLECWAGELVRSNEEFERFATAISHDLRAPLNSISMNLQLLAEDLQGGDYEEATHYVGRIESAVGRTTGMIDGVLEYSRVGQTANGRRPVSAEACLESSLANLEMLIQESRARVTHDELPEVPADAAKLTQLFQNLVGNAIKFSGEEPPHVHVGAEPHNGEWRFRVSDNGVGIPEQEADRIFDLFWRGPDGKKRPGKGVGLAICKKIVEGHGGRIWAERRPEGGTTFYFTLPAEVLEGLGMPPGRSFS